MRTERTHLGTCQICGAVQAADNRDSKLAQHGYRIPQEWREFVGVCIGSRHLPFELDKTIAEEDMDVSYLNAERLSKQAVEEENSTSPYYYDSQHNKHEINMVNFDSVKENLFPHKINPTLTDIIKSIHYLQAMSIKRKARAYKEHADWQKSRLENWEPKPLIEAEAVIKASEDAKEQRRKERQDKIDLKMQKRIIDPESVRNAASKHLEAGIKIYVDATNERPMKDPVTKRWSYHEKTAESVQELEAIIQRITAQPHLGPVKVSCEDCGNTVNVKYTQCKCLKEKVKIS